MSVKPYIHLLTDHMKQAVLVMDPAGQVQYCNDSAALLWKRDSERLLASNSKELFREDQTVLDKIEGVFKTGTVFQMRSYQLKTTPLQGQGAEIILAPLLNKTGGVDAALITLLESTTFHEAQALEREEQLAQSLGTMVSSLAHEIQNPLSGIKGMLQLLQRDLQDQEINSTSTEMMLSELGRIERLLKQMLFHSHPMPLEFSTFNVHELLNTVLLFVENTAPGIRFIRGFDLSLPDMEADCDKLHQVCLNLLQNAVEASASNASITITTRYCGKWELAGTNLNPSRNYTLISIEDEGEGIPESERPKLFKPFFTTKEKGHGLGLSISYRLIQAHSGLLRYVPGKNGGATFQVFMPHPSG